MSTPLSAFTQHMLERIDYAGRNGSAIVVVNDLIDLEHPYSRHTVLQQEIDSANKALYEDDPEWDFHDAENLVKRTTHAAVAFTLSLSEEYRMETPARGYENATQERQMVAARSEKCIPFVLRNVRLETCPPPCIHIPLGVYGARSPCLQCQGSRTSNDSPHLPSPAAPSKHPTKHKTSRPRDIKDEEYHQTIQNAPKRARLTPKRPNRPLPHKFTKNFPTNVSHHFTSEDLDESLMHALLRSASPSPSPPLTPPSSPPIPSPSFTNAQSHRPTSKKSKTNPKPTAKATGAKTHPRIAERFRPYGCYMCPNDYLSKEACRSHFVAHHQLHGHKWDRARMKVAMVKD